MIQRILLFLFLGCCAFGAHSQTDSLPSQSTLIAEGRKALRQAFFDDLRPDVQFWMDSLRRLEDDQYLALYWDERWLLYLWLENYTPLFSEVSAFTAAQEELNLYKAPPPADSLFDQLDDRLYENQAYLFDQIRKGWLSSEERAFASLLTDFLLRLSISEDQTKAFDAQLDSFLVKFPRSRFRSFIRLKMYNSPQPDDWALGLDLLFLHGTWSGDLERNLNPLFGADLGFCYWKKGWSVYFRFAIGAQKLTRDIVQNGFVWQKDESSTFLSLDIEGGYDLLNRSKIRIMPTIGGGFSSIHPPENEEDPNPDYYNNFKFNGGHLMAALQADIKFSPGKGNVPTTYHGVRVRLGYRWLNLSDGNPNMHGNMLFFAVGYSIFGRQARK